MVEREQEGFDKLSMCFGILALTGAGLFFLDRADVVQVDELVAVVSLWVGLALVGLVRSVMRLRDRVIARG